MAGRLTLLTSVISGIIGFWLGAFFLPEQVMKKVNSLCCSFLWHGVIGVSTGAKVSWDAISFPKNEGGLGIRSMGSWSETCMLKLIWLLFFRAGSLWVAWISDRYLSSKSFWALNESNYTYSWMFRKLLKLRLKALRFLRVVVCNGDSTFFWWDPWTPFGILFHFFGAEGPPLLGVPLFATVKDQRRGEGWLLSPARTEKQVLLYTYISTLVLNDMSDYPEWSVAGARQMNFVSKKVWNVVRCCKPIVPWMGLIWHKVRVPKHATTAWLFMLNRNPTLDRMLAWGLDVEARCLLCGDDNESRDQLFFHCFYSSEVWSMIMTKFGFGHYPTAWSDVINWLEHLHIEKHIKLALFQAWQAAIYFLWQERNCRFHSGLTNSSRTVYEQIRTTLVFKAMALQQLGSQHGLQLYHCWNPSNAGI